MIELVDEATRNFAKEYVRIHLFGIEFIMVLYLTFKLIGSDRAVAVIGRFSPIYSSQKGSTISIDGFYFYSCR